MDELVSAGFECAMKRLQQQSQPVDDFHIFASFVASELRKIKDPAYAQTTQRKLQKLLLQCMENEPTTTRGTVTRTR